MKTTSTVRLLCEMQKRGFVSLKFEPLREYVRVIAFGAPGEEKIILKTKDASGLHKLTRFCGMQDIRTLGGNFWGMHSPEEIAKEVAK